MLVTGISAHNYYCKMRSFRRLHVLSVRRFLTITRETLTGVQTPHSGQIVSENTFEEDAILWLTGEHKIFQDYRIH